MSSITNEIVLKETKHELELHKQEHTDQQEVCNNPNEIRRQHFFYCILIILI
jgi:hypothetical protein